MKTKRVLGGVLTGFLLVFSLASVTTNAADSPAAPQVKLAQTEATRVLSSIHEGDPRSAADTYNKLVKLRNTLKIEAGGDEAIYVYLTEPQSASDAQLIDVQIPVPNDTTRSDSDVDRAARQVGLGKASLKDRPAGTAVSVKKSPGVGDPTSLYEALFAYIEENGLRVVSPPSEAFAQAAQITKHCEYATLSTDISVSVASVEQPKPPEDPNDDARKPGEGR